MPRRPGGPVTGEERGAVVVTGASTGIGKACADHLHGLGFTVLAGVRKDADRDTIVAAGSDRLVPLQLDVTDHASVAAAADEVARTLGDRGLAGLVNNAGVAVSSPLEFVSLDRLRSQLDINVIGLVTTTQAFLPLLRAARGRIVNMGSTAGLHAMPFLGPYAASKFAVEALTDALRRELAPWGMHVAVVEPGPISTPIWDKAEGQAQELEQELPERCMELYGDALDGMRSFAQEAQRVAVPASVVAEAVAHALLAPRPRTRYPVGPSSRVVRLMRLLPDRLADWLVARELSRVQGS